MTEPDDELTARIRSLEAERLRPVPPPPISSSRPLTTAERMAALREVLEEIAAAEGETTEEVD